VGSQQASSSHTGIELHGSGQASSDVSPGYDRFGFHLFSAEKGKNRRYRLCTLTDRQNWTSEVGDVAKNLMGGQPNSLIFSSIEKTEREWNDTIDPYPE
jgi:hypothetical protein